MALGSNTESRITISATDRTRAAFTSARRNVLGLTESLTGMRLGLTALLGGAGLGALVARVTESGDELQKLSVRLGASVEALSQYRFVAERSGVSFDTLTLAWQRMTRRISEAASGTGEARDALRELGLSATELERLRPEQQFEVLADALAGVESSSDRVRLAMKLFDSEGVKVIQTMTDGARGLRAMRDEADSLGYTMTQAGAEDMAEFRDALTNIKTAAGGLVQELVINLGPTLTSIINTFRDAYTAGRKFFEVFSEPADVASLERLRDVQQQIVYHLDGQLSKAEKLNLTESDLWAITEKRYKALARIDELNKKIEAAKAREAAEPPAKFEVAPGAALPSLGDEKTAKAAAERAAREAQAERDRLRDRFEALQQYGKSELEALEEQHAERLLALNEAYDAEVASAQEYYDTLRGIETQYQNDRADAEKRAAELSARTAKGMHADVINELVATTQGVAQQNKALFAIYKAAAIAQAVLHAHEGASMTLSKYPWPLAGVLAAIHYAAGIAQVSAIASTSFGSAGGGGAPSAGGAVGTYPANPITGLPEQTQAPSRTNVTINLGANQSLIPASAVRELIEKINEQIADGVVIGELRVS